MLTFAVVTFLFVNTGVPLIRWIEAYYRTGFDLISYEPPPDKRYGRMQIEGWPTIEEMVQSGKRAVTFLSGGAREYLVPWLLAEFDYMFEVFLIYSGRFLTRRVRALADGSLQTDFGNESPWQFSCEPARPRWSDSYIPNRLSLVNHFLYAKFFGFRYPDAAHANQTNSANFEIGALGEHAARCRTRYERRPNFLLVDFFNEGDVWDVEHGMNAF